MILQTKNLTLQYPGKLLCRDLNLTVNSGECWAVLGQNGCGKTTLIHVLGGLRCADGGSADSVTVSGKASQTWPRRELARKLGIMLQEEPGEFWGNVREYVLLGRHPHVKNLFGWGVVDHDIANRAMERMELANFSHRSLDTLSGGERQRVRIALLLAQSPQCYLLDEPLQHLDLRYQLFAMMLFKELAAKGSAVMMVLHDITWVSRYCDHVLMLFENGRFLAGSVRELLTRDNLEELYQCSLDEFGVKVLRLPVPSTVVGV